MYTVYSYKNIQDNLLSNKIILGQIEKSIYSYKKKYNLVSNKLKFSKRRK